MQIGDQQTGDSSGCKLPSIYNFRDSNSDTGTHSAGFTLIPAPYGQTFFKKPSKRLSDGHIIIDITGTVISAFCCETSAKRLWSRNE